MTTGNCEDCGRWDSSLDTGVCPECKRRYQAYGISAQVIGISGPAGVGKDTAARIKDNLVVISDVRFQNEADFVRERGTLIHLTGRGGIGQGHQSELGLDAMPSDITIANDGDLKKLYGALYDAVIA